MQPQRAFAIIGTLLWYVMGCRDEKNVIGEILNFRVVSFACMCVRVRVKLFYFLVRFLAHGDVKPVH